MSSENLHQWREGRLAVEENREKALIFWVEQSQGKVKAA